MPTDALEWTNAAQVYATLSAGYRQAAGWRSVLPMVFSVPGTLSVSALVAAADLNEAKALDCLRAAGRVDFRDA